MPAKHSAPVAIDEDMVAVVMGVSRVFFDGVVGSRRSCRRLWGVETNWCRRESQMKEGRENLKCSRWQGESGEHTCTSGDASRSERAHGD